MLIYMFVLFMFLNLLLSSCEAVDFNRYRKKPNQGKKGKTISKRSSLQSFDLRPLTELFWNNSSSYSSLSTVESSISNILPSLIYPSMKQQQQQQRQTTDPLNTKYQFPSESSLVNVSLEDRKFPGISNFGGRMAYLCKFRPTKAVAPLIGTEIKLPLAYDNDNYQHLHFVCDAGNKNNKTNDMMSNNKQPRNYLFGNVTEHSFKTGCPTVIDYQGRSHASPFLCTASLEKKICRYELTNAIVSVCGGLIDISKNRAIPYTFEHSSMGRVNPIHNDEVHLKWMYYYTDNNYIRYIPEKMKVYDVVIPLRLLWDGNFGHLYHQSIPLIAHAMEFLPAHVTNMAYWHCSTPTAALLLLLGIPPSRIIDIKSFQKISKQQPVFAKKVVFPWITGWCPSNIPSLFGVANNILKIMTKNLLKMFESSSLNDTMSRSLQPTKRTIVYLTRAVGQTRTITNDDVILDMLHRFVNKDKYDLIIMNKTQEYRTTEDLHQIWYQYAKVFSKARVVIGAHGSAFGNIMWSPDDVDLVEFNVFPDDPAYTSPNSPSHHRPSLIAAAWAKGGTTKIFNIDPVRKSYDNFYDKNIQVSPYELLKVMELIGDDVLIPTHDISSLYYEHEHKFWDIGTSINDFMAMKKQEEASSRHQRFTKKRQANTKSAVLSEQPRGVRSNQAF